MLIQLSSTHRRNRQTELRIQKTSKPASLSRVKHQTSRLATSHPPPRHAHWQGSPALAIRRRSEATLRPSTRLDSTDLYPACCDVWCRTFLGVALLAGCWLERQVGGCR